MKIFTKWILSLAALTVSGCGSPRPISHEILRRADVDIQEGCPGQLVDVREVFTADFVLFDFREFLAPLPDDPPDAIGRVAHISRFFFEPKKAHQLPFSLGEALTEDAPEASQVVLLQPLYLIAVDGEGDRWLLEIRRQDSIVSVMKLRPACMQPPHDNLYWQDVEDPQYYAGDTKLHEFFADELEMKGHPNHPLQDAGVSPSP